MSFTSEIYRRKNTPKRAPTRRFVPRLEYLEDRTVPSTGLGPVIDLSDPDVIASLGSNGAEKETYIAVNPTNPGTLSPPGLADLRWARLPP